MESEFLKKFTAVLECEEPIGWDNKFREYDTWSSLTYLATISFIDDEYGVYVSREEFNKLKSVRELFEYIKANKK